MVKGVGFLELIEFILLGYGIKFESELVPFQ